MTRGVAGAAWLNYRCACRRPFCLSPQRTSSWDRTMKERSGWVPVLVIPLLVVLLNLWTGPARQVTFAAADSLKTPASHQLLLNTFSGHKILPHGIEVYSGKA